MCLRPAITSQTANDRSGATSILISLRASSYQSAKSSKTEPAFPQNRAPVLGKKPFWYSVTPESTFSLDI
jgi:hypothetical protein